MGCCSAKEKTNKDKNKEPSKKQEVGAKTPDGEGKARSNNETLNQRRQFQEKPNQENIAGENQNDTPEDGLLEDVGSSKHSENAESPPPINKKTLL